MRALVALLVAALLCAATPAFSQRPEAVDPPARTEGESALKSGNVSDAAKNEARKARREHRRTVNHRQRRKH